MQISWQQKMDWQAEKLHPVAERLLHNTFAVGRDYTFTDLQKAMRQACIRLSASESEFDRQMANIVLAEIEAAHPSA